MSGGAPEPWEGKVADEELRDLSGSESAGVIVQLELPRPRVEMERSELGGIGVRPERIEPETENERRNADERIAQAKTFLEQLLGRPPVWLGAANAFGVEASGDQLRAIARSPLVRRIYLSRLRR